MASDDAVVSTAFQQWLCGRAGRGISLAFLFHCLAN